MNEVKSQPIHPEIQVVHKINLYRATIALSGAKPTLIEWDNDVPEWPVLAAEAARVRELVG